MTRLLFFAILGGLGWLLYRRWERSRRTRPEAGGKPREQYVQYKSLLRTNDVGLITILKSLLEEKGIRYYASQSSYLHLGEIQLFVERDRLEHAEAILERLDTPDPEERP